MLLVLFLGFVLLGGCAQTTPQGIESTEPLAPRWWRGNLHTHSFWSDGDGFAELALRDYRDAGYHFVALTEHDNVASHTASRTLQQIADRSCGQAYADYAERWGDPKLDLGAPTGAVELTPIAEIAKELDEEQRFLVLRGEEISAAAAGLRVHVTTVLPNAVVRPVFADDVPTALRANIAAARSDNPAALIVVNHPNHDYAVTAEDLYSIREIDYVEIFSGHRGVRTLGDGNHPPVDRLWDVANTMRIAQQGWAPIYGIATDDAHDYYCDLDARPFRAYVQVRAAALDAKSLFTAMSAGDFYASTGVDLAALNYDAEHRRLDVRVVEEEGVHYVIEIRGTRSDFDPSHTPRVPSEGFTRISDSYSEDIGRVLARFEGPVASYSLSPDDLFVRAVVTSDRVLDTTQNVYPWQVAQAWTQPVGWENRVVR